MLSLLGYAASLWLKTNGVERIVAFACVTGVLAGIVALHQGWRRRARLVLVDGTLLYTGLLGTRVVARRGVGRVVGVRLAQTGMPHPTASLLWLDADGTTTLRVTEDEWDAAELDALRRDLALPRETEPAPLAPNALCERYPRAVPWFIAHPRWTAVIIVVVPCATAVAIQQL